MSNTKMVLLVNGSGNENAVIVDVESANLAIGPAGNVTVTARVSADQIDAAVTGLELARPIPAAKRPNNPYQTAIADKTVSAAGPRASGCCPPTHTAPEPGSPRLSHPEQGEKPPPKKRRGRPPKPKKSPPPPRPLPPEDPNSPYSDFDLTSPHYAPDCKYKIIGCEQGQAELCGNCIHKGKKPEDWANCTTHPDFIDGRCPDGNCCGDSLCPYSMRHPGLCAPKPIDGRCSNCDNEICRRAVNVRTCDNWGHLCSACAKKEGCLDYASGIAQEEVADKERREAIAKSRPGA